MEKLKAYYFAPESGKLRYNDGRIIKVGETHSVSCSPKVCEQGLHASLRPIDALKYAPSPQLYIVNVRGQIDKGSDKIAGTHREYLIKVPNCEQLLREFAHKTALYVVLKHYPSIDAVVIKYLETGDESIRSAAEYAAWSAACSGMCMPLFVFAFPL